MQRQNLEAEQERQELLAKKKNGAIQSNAVPAARPPEPVPPVPQAMQSTADTAAPAAATTSPEPAPVPSPTAQTSRKVGTARQGSSQAGRTSGERTRRAAQVRSLSHRRHAATVDSRHGSSDSDFHPYWYGVETHDGQHGWMLRDQLELTP